MSLVTVGDIRWASYNDREGPVYLGHYRYELSPTASVKEKFLKVISTAEGDRYDAVNMYDRAGVSLGLIQWSEIGTGNAVRLLNKVCKKINERVVTRALAPALEMSNAAFRQNSGGYWKFFVEDVEIRAPEQLRDMLYGCTGLKGSWGEPDSAQRLRAKTWAAGFANIWNDPAARAVQVDLATSEMINYAFGASRATMFGDVAEVLSSGMVAATRAMYLMYAINLPSVADSMCQRAVKNTSAEKWSYDWCIDVIRELVYGPSISIYVHRYNAAKSVVESLFGVTLPDAEDLAQDVKKSSSSVNVLGTINSATLEHGLPVSHAIKDPGDDR